MNTKNFNFIDNSLAKYRLNKISKHIEDGDVILDFGCGSHSFLLESAKDKIKIGVGLDYDVKNNTIDNIKYLQFKFSNKLPFTNNYFNKIVLLAVLEHIDPKKICALFSEFKRILKKEGIIILTTPTPASKVLLEFLAYKLKLISEGEIRDHKKYYTKNDITLVAKKAGLKLKYYRKFQLGLNSYAVIKQGN